MTVADAKLDVVVAGAGITGLAFAVALRQALGPTCRIAVFADAPGPQKSAQAFAIAPGPRRMLQRLGVWDALADRAQPIVRMEITDSAPRDAVRPTWLHFGEPDGSAPLAHMVRQSDFIAALRRAAEQGGIAILPTGIRDFTADDNIVTLEDRSGHRHRVDLLVAADGGRSRVRDLAGIGTIEHAYDAAGLVATIGHERPHEGVAIQHFLPPGPLALLPLRGRESSIVWTETRREARRLVALPRDALLAEVEARAGLSRGKLTLVDEPMMFPLSLRVARRFVGHRVALIGDAAHVLHPLAGQNLNLGLRDVAVLAEIVIENARLGLTPGDPAGLAAYERRRRFDTLANALATQALDRLFGAGGLPMRLARDLGMGLVDRAPGLRQRLEREAAGEAGRVPALMRDFAA